MTERRDTGGAFAIAIAAGPFVLPVIGVRPADLLFAVPMIVLPWSTVCAVRAARTRPERATMWTGLALACATATLASLFGLLSSLEGYGEKAGLYAGVAGSALLVVAGFAAARRAVAKLGWASLVDPFLLLGVPVSLSVYLLLVPGLEHGDLVLTAAETMDVVGFALIAAGTIGGVPQGVRAPLLVGMATVCAGDAVPLASATGHSLLPFGATPLLWAVAGWVLAIAAGADVSWRPQADELPSEPSGRRAYLRVLLPLVAIVAYPAIAGILVVLQGSWLGPVGFFAPWFLVSTVVAFSRQAVVLVEQRRAAARERRLRAEALRRNRQLEALTALATTMTEVLDERPVVERGLEALSVAARAGSTALHLAGEDRLLELTATTGAWGQDREWASVGNELLDEPRLLHRGRRHIVHLPLAAHGTPIGLVTLSRPVSEGAYEDEELELLALLVDQLAVALQNARDYHEKLEAAIRDPLTGLYNRRFFYEAFAKEIARHERYGTGAALVLFDVDDFKRINDTFGHAAGDEVLKQVGQIVAGVVRPSDTFARVGGEEFGLLLPETGQLDALLVAERLRTALARHPALPGRSVTISGGVAAMPQDGTTREELERRADQALYWAKRNGKNLCAVASEAIAADTEAVQEGMLAHLHGVVAGIDAEHLHTRDHSENVAAYAVAVSQALGLEADQIVRVRRAAFLHDIGKVAVPDAILAKPAGLTDEEFDYIRLHPSVGATMLHHAGLHDEGRWVRAHHERIDGCGYPDGLSGDEIPLESRILFVADSFEAMTSDRPYRRGMPIADALAELRRCAGTQFDPRVVEALAGLVENDQLAVMALRD